MHYHTKTCKKSQRSRCRFNFPFPPMDKTMVLHPLYHDANKVTKKIEITNLSFAP